MCMINPNVYDRAVVPHIPSIPSQDWPVIQMTRASGSSIWWSSGSDASLYTHEEKSRMAKRRTERLKKGDRKERLLQESNGKVDSLFLLLSPVELGMEQCKSLGMQILRRATNHTLHMDFLHCWSLQFIQSVHVLHLATFFDSSHILIPSSTAAAKMKF